MCLIFLLMHAKFEGNPITCLHFMAVFCKCAKRRERKKRRKWATFWRLIFQDQLARFTSDLVSVLSWYAGTCTVNLVLFGQETMELQMCVKSYFLLRVNILTLCAHAPSARHTTMCLDKRQFNFSLMQEHIALSWIYKINALFITILNRNIK